MDNFFGSKLNTVLLFVLIILMVIALRIMLKDKGTYLAPFVQEQEQISGNKDDLVSFSILPGSKLHGIVSYRGVIKGAYFFEANILINVLDVNKNVLKKSHAMATIDWMTAGPVDFEGNIDFSDMPKGPAYFEIHNDNPSDMRQYDKSVLIPIVIE
ncbi:MAG: Gmad2 immunoglobulin-like domain-containing protein [Patescibacteria group bacterium]